MQCRGFVAPSDTAKTRQNANAQKVFMPIDKRIDRIFATPKTFGAVYPLMKGHIVLLLLIFFAAGSIPGQDTVPTATPAHRRGWLSRILHPFSPELVPQYKDARLRGLALDI